MTMDRTPLNDSEEAWIAKYRASLGNTPVRQSRSAKVRQALNSVHNVVIWHIGSIFNRWTRAHSQKSARSSEPTLISQAQTSTRNAGPAESNANQSASWLAPPPTSKAFEGEHVGAWRERPVA
jgi:hypothetical protein